MKQSSSYSNPRGFRPLLKRVARGLVSALVLGLQPFLLVMLFHIVKNRGIEIQDWYAFGLFLAGVALTSFWAVSPVIGRGYTIFSNDATTSTEDD